jgi:hypothetical protein
MGYKGICGLALVLATLGACVRVDDPHADPQTRMNAVAVRFDQAFRTGGMARVTSEIQECYRQTTAPFIEHYALEDCMALDYAGHQIDVSVGRQALKGPPLPFFEDQVFGARAAHYGQLAGFTSPAVLANFLRATWVLVSGDLAQLNAGPIIVHD